VSIVGLGVGGSELKCVAVARLTIGESELLLHLLLISGEKSDTIHVRMFVWAVGLASDNFFEGGAGIISTIRRYVLIEEARVK